MPADKLLLKHETKTPHFFVSVSLLSVREYHTGDQNYERSIVFSTLSTVAFLVENVYLK